MKSSTPDPIATASSDEIGLDFPAPFVAVVTLNRPPVNALGRRFREAFIDTMDSLQDRDDVRVIILTASGKIFCAGADIKERQDIGVQNGGHQRANRITREGFYCVLDSVKPVIAAINGPALGAGFVLAACCDFIFSADHATFSMPEIDVGMGGGASFLQRVLPPCKIRRLMLTGEALSCQELHRLGAVEACVPSAQLMSTALALAQTIAQKSPPAVRTIRESFLTVEGLGLREGFRFEQNYITPLSKSPEALEARQAFIEKRKAVF